MVNYDYNFEIMRMTQHFVAALDDIKVKRFDGERYAKEKIKVPIHISPKHATAEDLIGKTDAFRLPIMSIRKTSEQRNPERIKNKEIILNYVNADGQYTSIQAIPWTMEFECTILCKFQEDLYQIVNCIAQHFNPYITISWREPKSGRDLRSTVRWSGSFSHEFPGDNQTNTDPVSRITTTTQFTIEGWILITGIEDEQRICTIHSNYVFTDKFFCDLDDLSDYSRDNSTESYVLTGRPILRYVNPYYILQGTSPRITVQGFGLGEVTGLYVSGSPGMYTHTTYDPLSSGNYFDGLFIDEINKSENSISFTLPPASAIGFVDIIATNPCGIGKLTVDADRCNRVENPYPITDPEHYNWCVLQFPYLNGLVVSNDHNTPVIDETKQIIELVEADMLDRDAIIQKIKELMEEGNISVDDLV